MPMPQLDDPDLSLKDMMSFWPATIGVFARHKMLCVGCMIGPFHTLLDACAEYHLDHASLLKELRDVAFPEL